MGSLNILIIQVAFLALPGIIGCRLFRTLRGNPEQKNWEDFVEILLFSLLSYVLYGLSLSVLNSVFETTFHLSVFQTLLGSKSSTSGADSALTINWVEIAFASGYGVVLAFAASFFNRYKIINKMGRRLKCTHRYGDEDVWEHLLNIERIEWAFVRDHKLNLMYFGRIHAWSDSGKARELLLQELRVHDNKTGDELYATDVMYLSRDPFGLTIEIPRYTKKMVDREQEPSR